MSNQDDLISVRAPAAGWSLRLRFPARHSPSGRRHRAWGWNVASAQTLTPMDFDHLGRVFANPQFDFPSEAAVPVAGDGQPAPTTTPAYASAKKVGGFNELA